MLRVDYLFFVFVHFSGFILQYSLPAFQSVNAKSIILLELGIGQVYIRF